MSSRPPQFANEDEEAQYYLGLLRSGTPAERITARAQLASIFESRGMIEEATELLEGNVRAGIRERALYTKLASLYRRLGRDDDADAAIAEASLLAGPPPQRPRPAQQPTRQQQPRQQQPQPQYQQYAPQPPPQKRGGFSFGKFLMFGCLGILILGALAVGGVCVNIGGNVTRMAQESNAKATADAARPPAKVGETSEQGNWAVHLDKVEVAPSLRSGPSEKRAQGVYVVLTYNVTNRTKATSVLNSTDFEMKAPDGTTYRTSSDGQTSLSGEPRPLTLLEQIQPGLSKAYRSVFDVNPSIKDYTLIAAGNRFAVTLP